MPTVVDLSGQGGTRERALTYHNRTTAADPNGALTPLYSGEIVLATTPKLLYQAQDLTNTSWVPTVPNMYGAG